MQTTLIENMQCIPNLLSERSYSEDKIVQTFNEVVAKELVVE